MEPNTESPKNMNLFVGLQQGLGNYSPWASTCAHKKGLLKYSHTLIFVLSTSAFMTQGQS